MEAISILFILVLYAAAGSTLGLLLTMVLMPHARRWLGGWALMMIPITVFGGAFVGLCIAIARLGLSLA